MSAHFERFLKSNFFGNPFNAWHDGLEVETLTALQGEDRDKAEQMLLKALPDSRAIVGLGELRSEKALQPLRMLLKDKTVSTEAAVALFKISGETSGSDAPIMKLRDRQSHWSGRMDAAIALRHFRTVQSVDALLDALNDPEGLVRHHAAKSLLELYEGKSRAGAPNAESVAIRIMRENERAAAADELRQMVSVAENRLEPDDHTIFDGDGAHL